MKRFKLDAAGLSDRGMKRDHNEDAWSGPPAELTEGQLAAKGRLYVVADGVGGHLAGDVASAMAVAIIQQQYYADPTPDIPTRLANAIRMAGDRIGQQSATNQDQRGMSTTVTAAVLHGDRLFVANVGDSRTYLIPGKHSKGHGTEAQQITTDHTWVEEQVQAGLITREQAARHPHRNIITRSLGNDQFLTIDIFEEQVRPGDRVLLCSDGLSNMVTAREIGAIVRRGRDADAIVHELVALANERGAPDNVTAVLLDIKPSRSRLGSPPAILISGALLGVLAWVLLTRGEPAGAPPSTPVPSATFPPSASIAGTGVTPMA